MTVVGWKSPINGSWTTSTNWSTGVVPAAGDAVTIGVGGSYTVSIAALPPVTVGSLTVSDPNAVLAIDASGAGGSNIATGTLGNNGRIEIGNASLAAATTVAVGGLTNIGEVDLTGSAAVQAALLVEPAAPGTLTGKFFLSGDALLGFETGAVTAIGNLAELSLSGPKARAALGTTPDASGALTSLGSSLGTLQLESGAILDTGVDFLNNGIVSVDNNSGSGGSRLTFGGRLTNRGNLVIGNSLLTAATFVAAKDLVNAREIDLTGSGAVQATLDIGAPAPATFTGIDRLSGDALLEFGGGVINNIVIGAILSLSGPDARLALAAKPGGNTALAGLTGNAGAFDIENGAAVFITGSYTNTGTTTVDTGSGAGGSTLTIGGNFTNSPIINPNGLKIGNAFLGAATFVKAVEVQNFGEIDLSGAPFVQATLDITGAAAATLTGKFMLTNDALVEYGSGGIIGIGSGAELSLDGAASRIARAASSGTNSALTGLAGNLGTLRLDGGAAVAITTGFKNSNIVQIDDAGGGSSLKIGGTFTNAGRITIGNPVLAAVSTLTAAALANSGEIDLVGAPLVQATLDIAALAPSVLSGSYSLTNDALLDYGGGVISTISSGAQLTLNGVEARLAAGSATGGNSALAHLAGNSGTLRIENGETLGLQADFLNSGSLAIDDIGGGSRLTIGAALTNTGRLAIGNSALGAPTTVAAAAAANGGEIDLTSGRTNEATLAIAGAFSNAGLIQVDAGFGSGGSALKIGGTLSNAALGFKALRIGNLGLGAPTTVTARALANPGEIDLTGAPSVQATLAVATAAPATLTGIYKLAGDALLEYASGRVSAIGSGAELSLGGVAARMADASAPASNSALTVLAVNNGELSLSAGARLGLVAGLSNGNLLVVDNTGAGGSSLTIGGTLSNSGIVDIGNSSSQTLAATVTATGLDNLIGGSVAIAGRAGPAALTSTGAASDAGSIVIDAQGVLTLGKGLDVASAGTLTLNGGEIKGGSLSGSGTIGSAAGSSSTLDGVTIAAGASFAAGAGSVLTIDHVTVAGSLLGGGSAGLAFGVAGSDPMTRVSGFPTVTLADGGANVLTLSAANFAVIPGNTITVYDGDGGTTLTASTLPSSDAIIVHAGSGTDKLTGGAGNDNFFAGGHTTMTGRAGTNEFVFYGPGTGNLVTDFSASAKNQIVFSNFAFSLGQQGASAAPERLPSNLFVANATGKFTSATQRFAYDTANGKLLFSAAGSTSTPELVATLSNHPALSAAQLFFIT